MMFFFLQFRHKTIVACENRPLLYTEQRQHTQYLLEKTVNSMVNGPRPFKFGIDTSAYRHAKYSWRHKILTKLYFLAD